MTLQITIVSAGGDSLPNGSPVRVEVRDTSLADAPAKLVRRVDLAVPETKRTSSLSVRIDIASVPDGTTLWAHVDVDRDGRVSEGDLVSTESYPVSQAARQALTIRVKKVG
jgi:uncharacterized lipoprotein YbaY